MRSAVNMQHLGGELAPQLDWLRELEVGLVELWPSNLAGGHDEESWHRYEEKEVAGAKKALAAAGMEVWCLTLGFFALPLALQRGGTAAMRAALDGAVDAAADLGASRVACYLAGVPAKMFVQAAQPAAERAAACGICIALENEAHDDSGTAAGVRAIVDAVASAGFGTVFDPCNYLQADDEAFPAAVEILGDAIRAVHLKGGSRYRDGSGLHRGGSLRNGSGAIGYGPLAEAAYHPEAVLRRLIADGYDGAITIEPHVPRAVLQATIRADLQWLREHLP